MSTFLTFKILLRFYYYSTVLPQLYPVSYFLTSLCRRLACYSHSDISFYTHGHIFMGICTPKNIPSNLKPSWSECGSHPFCWYFRHFNPISSLPLLNVHFIFRHVSLTFTLPLFLPLKIQLFEDFEKNKTNNQS